MPLDGSRAMSKIRKSARGQACTLRLAPDCDPETVVFCHIQPRAHGRVGSKVADLFGCYGCHACHDIIDRRGAWREVPADLVAERKLSAMIETQTLLLGLGLVVLK